MKVSVENILNERAFTWWSVAHFESSTVRSYTYGNGQTLIKVYDAAGTLVAQWTRFIDEEGRDNGYSNVSGCRWENFYDDPANPRLPTRQRDPEGRETLTTYDAFGNVTGITTPRGVKATFTWNYDSWRFGRLASVRKSATPAGGGGTTTLPPSTFTYYEPSGLLQSATEPHPGGAGTVVTQYAYDTYGNLTGIVDARGQLSGESSDRGVDYNHALGYDGAGNPTLWRGASTRTFNANNQETTGGLFSYDGMGNPLVYLNRNQTANGTTFTPKSQVLSYTSSGQLAQINNRNTDGSVGAALAGYGYRADGLRAWKQDANGNRTFFYYNEEGQLLSWQGQSSPSIMPLLMRGADGLLGYRYTDAQGNNRARYFTFNLHGDLTQALDESGNVAETGAFNGHGMPLRDGNGVLGASGMFGYGAKFGYVRDGESGFYLCGYRYYDPSAGRWLTRDPIEYDGGANLYGYGVNDPVNTIDPNGLDHRWMRGIQRGYGYLTPIHPRVRYGYATNVSGIVYYGKKWTEGQKKKARDNDKGWLSCKTNHGKDGMFDFKNGAAGMDPSDRIFLNGRWVSPGAFGNYLTGYGSYKALGGEGYLAAIMGGHVFEFGSWLSNRAGNPNTRDDGYDKPYDSIKDQSYILEGAADAGMTRAEFHQLVGKSR